MKKKLLAIVLILMLVLSACSNEQKPTDPTLPEPTTEATQPTETTQATEPTETTQATEETTEPPLPQPDPVSFEEALASNDLRTQREWFFDFAQQYRIDYIPCFTPEEGAPIESVYMLYWCFTIDAFEPGEIYGTMSKNYVEETILTYFGTEYGEHQSHFKSWNYDEETGLYTVWPEGGKSEGLFVLDTLIENTDGTYSVHAYEYQPNYRYDFGYDDSFDRLCRDALLDTKNDNTIKMLDHNGTTYAFDPGAEITITFSIDSETGLPLFRSLSVTMLDFDRHWVE